MAKALEAAYVSIPNDLNGISCIWRKRRLCMRFDSAGSRIPFSSNPGRVGMDTCPRRALNSSPGTAILSWPGIYFTRFRSPFKPHRQAPWSRSRKRTHIFMHTLNADPYWLVCLVPPLGIECNRLVFRVQLSRRGLEES